MFAAVSSPSTTIIRDFITKKNTTEYRSIDWISRLTQENSDIWKACASHNSSDQ